MRDLFLFIGIGVFFGFAAWIITRQNTYKQLLIRILVSGFGSLGGGYVARTLNFTQTNDLFIASLVFSVIGAILPILIVYLLKIND